MENMFRLFKREIQGLKAGSKQSCFLTFLMCYIKVGDAFGWVRSPLSERPFYSESLCMASSILPYCFEHGWGRSFKCLFDGQHLLCHFNRGDSHEKAELWVCQGPYHSRSQQELQIMNSPFNIMIVGCIMLDWGKRKKKEERILTHLSYFKVFLISQKF